VVQKSICLSGLKLIIGSEEDGHLGENNASTLRSATNPAHVDAEVAVEVTTANYTEDDAEEIEPVAQPIVPMSGSIVPTKRKKRGRPPGAKNKINSEKPANRFMGDTHFMYSGSIEFLS